MTQFGRALHDLNIDLICANSSQAKGCVERANLTLKDRLVKEMRLENISGIDKRLSAVLKLAQEKQDELEAAGKRKRSRHMPKRRAQVQEQLRAINPVLADPSLFKSSLKK